MLASWIRRLEEPDIEVVNCHAISLDEQFLALCANAEEIYIFELVSEQDIIETAAFALVALG